MGKVAAEKSKSDMAVDTFQAMIRASCRQLADIADYIRQRDEHAFRLFDEALRASLTSEAVSRGIGAAILAVCGVEMPPASRMASRDGEGLDVESMKEDEA